MTEREETQAAQIMTLMAEKSSVETELVRVRGLIEQHYRDNEGHNHCWRNNHRLWEGIGLRPKTLNLPPRQEAEHGCKVFWDQLYSEPNIYPDFISR
jgi:hypothetical protein